MIREAIAELAEAVRLLNIRDKKAENYHDIKKILGKVHALQNKL